VHVPCHLIALHNEIEFYGTEFQGKPIVLYTSVLKRNLIVFGFARTAGDFVASRFSVT